MYLKLMKNLSIKLFSLVLPAMALTACDGHPVFEYEGDCDPNYYVQFVYDMNLLKADAFYTQVESVDLYIFDAATHKPVAHYTESGEPLTHKDYLMPIDVKPGDYYFVAWGGLKDNEDHFTVPAYDQLTHRDDLICTMARDFDAEANIAYSNKNLHPLFHGSVTTNLPDEEGNHITTVYLTKDTNNLVFHLMHTEGELNPKDFRVVIEDKGDSHSNLKMNHDNSILADERVEHRPWGVRSGYFDKGEIQTKDGDEEQSGSGSLSDINGSMIVEFSTARLMKENTKTRDLVVYDNNTGEEKFRFPFIGTAFYERSMNYSNMEDQEYLDRQDNYNFTVILSGRDWLAIEIVINGWHIVDNGNVGL